MGAIGDGVMSKSLHHPDGSHRSTARTAKGRDLDRFEGALQRHLALHTERRDRIDRAFFSLEELFERDGINLVSYSKLSPRVRETPHRTRMIEHPYQVEFVRGDARVEWIYRAPDSEAKEIDTATGASGARRRGARLLACQAFLSMISGAKLVQGTSNAAESVRAQGGKEVTPALQEKYVEDLKLAQLAKSLLGDLFMYYLNYEID